MPTPEEIAAAAAAKAAEDAAKAEANKAKADAEKTKDPLAAFEAYLETLPEDQRLKIEEHTTGLRTALIKERKLNPESKKALEELQKLKEADEKRKHDEMTVQQKAEADKKKAEDEAAQLRKDLQEERVKNAILAAAKDFVDPQDAYAMIDRDLIETDKDGKVTGVEDAIKALVKAKPYLVGETNAQVFDINGGSKGKGSKGANQDEIIKKKRHDYQPL